MKEFGRPVLVTIKPWATMISEIGQEKPAGDKGATDGDLHLHLIFHIDPQGRLDDIVEVFGNVPGLPVDLRSSSLGTKLGSFFVARLDGHAYWNSLRIPQTTMTILYETARKTLAERRGIRL